MTMNKNTETNWAAEAKGEKGHIQLVINEIKVP